MTAPHEPPRITAHPAFPLVQVLGEIAARVVRGADGATDDDRQPPDKAPAAGDRPAAVDGGRSMGAGPCSTVDHPHPPEVLVYGLDSAPRIRSRRPVGRVVRGRHGGAPTTGQRPSLVGAEALIAEDVPIADREDGR